MNKQKIKNCIIMDIQLIKQTRKKQFRMVVSIKDHHSHFTQLELNELFDTINKLPETILEHFNQYLEKEKWEE